MLDLMSDMYDKIGIKLIPSFNTWPAFIEKFNRRQAQIYQLGWVADYPDAENFYNFFYETTSLQDQIIQIIEMTNL